jgi:hypothetical protein
MCDMIRDVREGGRHIHPLQSYQILTFMSKQWIGLAHHIKCYDIFEGYFTILVLLNETFVNEFWATSGWEPKYEWLGGSRIERLDAICTYILVRR